ncbi:sensor histidine kinase [Neotamlana laminarinivorans]|uniref:histidine kinase n=1 Tax=Neotamlana laminarinivorans TaxID=2883124 RepID=A0A9X1L155_9FLAO|nr:ATP-binding protein [Tamlana laminarinivorans]MCB4798285.1 histidine kinase [Tamlana laminarinivorans]
MRSLILIIINSLVFLVIVLLSVTFYNQFSKVLDDRILLQLNSIKTLKQIQIERLITSEWEAFRYNPQMASFSDSLKILNSEQLFSSSGVYDLTEFHLNKKTSIALVLRDSNQTKIKVIDYNKIKNILLERTGMGESGESYLVGQDFYLRSQSRFLTQKTPATILAKTVGVTQAFLGQSGRGIYPDYRGIKVYGVYDVIKIKNLKLAIVSEIDENEVNAPLKDLRLRLFGLIVLITVLAIILSLFLTRIITNPVENMKKSLKIMANGDYSESHQFNKNFTEIAEMFNALGQLKKSLQGAVSFSENIGKMNLNAQYTPKSTNDVLGKSLVKMRDKLVEFRNNENKNRLNTKRQLVDGLEKERRRLARELHDGLGPLLTSLKFYIDNKIKNDAQRLEMKTILDETITEIRVMSNALMPSSIDDFGVSTAILNFIESIKNSTKTQIIFEDLTKQNDSKITKNQQINIFRITQELINNTIKHAQASHIRITLSEFDDFISLFYFDDGIGFNLNHVTLGSGITNIKERVDICNGHVNINSKAGNTTFEIELPIDYETN